jgi:hypothetical protein
VSAARRELVNLLRELDKGGVISLSDSSRAEEAYVT